ncbi:MAG: nicotinate phosphoribosyltransferase [Acidobacteriota bacterium]
MGIVQGYSPELVTDLYELTMAESYLREGMRSEATFSLFVRNYPKDRSFFVSAGIDEFLDLLPRFRFDGESIAYIRSLGRFSDDFLQYLSEFRFTGEVRAIPEGRLFFANEPVLEVTAPLIEAQVLETLAINALQLEILVATKAARCREAARGKPLVDFSLRRTHGVDAALKVARGSYIAGFAGTSNLLAGRLYDIPVFGTMAHSYVTSFKSEELAFEAFARAFPKNTVLLIDTYDTMSGARKALKVAREMVARGYPLPGVRLDSGDLVALSREVRQLFTEAGFPEVLIMASGSLDEIELKRLIEAGAEIDVFAVGTRIGVSADAPYLDMVYKLVEYEGRPIIKLSSGKKTWVGRKQVYRFCDEWGKMSHDVLDTEGSIHPGGEPLLRQVVKGGERTVEPDALSVVRERFLEDWNRLPDAYKDLEPKAYYPVRVSEALQELDRKTAEEKRLKEVESYGG